MCTKAKQHQGKQWIKQHENLTLGNIHEFILFGNSHTPLNLSW